MAFSPLVCVPKEIFALRFPIPEVLRLRDYRNLWLGQAISQLGDAFYYVAFMFMVKKVTGDVGMVGLVGALETVPYLLFGPYAGVLADRLDRRRIMLLSDLFCGLALVGFAATIVVGGKPPVWALLITPFLLSAVRCFFMPAKSASIPKLVPPELLQKANAFSMATQNVMQMSSLAFTAGVLGLVFDKSPVVFYTTTISLNALSFLLSAVFIAKLPVILPDRKDQAETHVWQDLKDGLAYLKTRRELNVLTAMLAVFRLCVAPFFVVYLAANEQWFGDRPQTVTWFEFSFFAGMVIATGFAGKVKVLHPTVWFCAGLGAIGVFVAFMAFSPYVWMFVLWNLMCGLAVPLADVPILTYLQRSVPDLYQGRVNAVRDMIATGVMPLGMGIGGILVKEVGLVASFLIMGIGMAGACLVGFLDRQFREVTMPDDPGKAPEPNLLHSITHVSSPLEPVESVPHE